MRQCQLLRLSRSTYYYNKRPIDKYNLRLMNLLDEQYLETPFYGVRRFTHWLLREGHHVNHKRVRRLMLLMGFHAIYPKPRLSMGVKNHKKYPYLLSSLAITRPDQVWCADITYIRLQRGFVYLVAVMDWFSRYVLSWELSNSLEAQFCCAALNKAFRHGTPDIFNSDQGAQFTSSDFTKRLLSRSIKISMDGRGRVFDNIFIERLWRSLKHEDIYLKDYETVQDCCRGLSDYFLFYNR
ncbi:IS3 family transposase [candidate division CSSED10-310 bacterium]|uniref:IS3 family transposase n=1 Tax=candidate division CSSED10-310 bacterium TaxID=2855610 RepID=A0ABV6YYF8_UNCC1